MWRHERTGKSAFLQPLIKSLVTTVIISEKLNELKKKSVGKAMEISSYYHLKLLINHQKVDINRYCVPSVEK